MDIFQSKENILKIEADVLVVGIFKGAKLTGTIKKIDEALEGKLKAITKDEKFDGELGKSLMLNSTFGKIGSERVLLLGLGNKQEFSSVNLRKVAALASKKVKNYCSIIAFDSLFCSKSGYISALFEGLLLGSYEFNKYKTHKSNNKTKKVICISSSVKGDAFDREADLARTVSDSTNLARDLVNEPPIYLTPTKLSDIALEVAEEVNLKCEIFDLKEIIKKAMGGLMAVSSGSDQEPRFIHLEYEPPKKTRKSIAVVGKGITFDSGGLCLKPPDSMRTMKMDMAGSATVIGIMRAIAILKPSVKVHGLIAASENMTGGKAYKPDDVIRAYNGKSIEIVNTDAEGRLVLSDALSYAVELGADEIVDLATLTGACIVGLGNYTAGIMGNDHTLIDKLREASDKVGEKTWELPMDDELRAELESSVADVKHVGNRWGGAITAAMFLENFVGDVPWAHLDIAGPAFLEKSSNWSPKGGTGFGVRTLVEYIMNK